RCPATPLARITALVWAGGPLGQFRLRGVAAARYAKVLSLQPGCGLATCRAVSLPLYSGESGGFVIV
ncbi:MAG TPA: hypothetical protein VHI51_16750, partial [Ktedonobacterales bacterium]|nr:hypothetical protein [Ktedonobacterales bacterium]